ncbi:MAG: hypothetical protein EPO25_17265 [Gammaproteobacteria bacterium]|nr:MAG: hypothetical protein EPO25_17265 [Gammaproteobacteria bacterium]
MDWSTLIDSKAAISVLSAAGGALLANLLMLLRGRIRVLEYTALHNQIGSSGNDPVFGQVTVAWQGHSVSNLFSSVVSLSNDTTKDLSCLRVKIYTGNETLLLNESTEIVGTTQIVKWKESFSNLLHVPENSAPTQAQFETYHHNREYMIPVLNRGQTAVFRYLTTVTSAPGSPSVWTEVQQLGLKALYVPQVPVVHGAPQRYAVWLGLFAALASVVAATLLLSSLWLAALICCVVGLFAQGIGAILFRFARAMKRLVLH